MAWKLLLFSLTVISSKLLKLLGHCPDQTIQIINVNPMARIQCQYFQIMTILATAIHCLDLNGSQLLKNITAPCAILSSSNHLVNRPLVAHTSTNSTSNTKYQYFADGFQIQCSIAAAGTCLALENYSRYLPCLSQHPNQTWIIHTHDRFHSGFVVNS